MASLPEAIEQKYGDQGSINADVSCIALNLRRCGINRPPSVLILTGCEIEIAGDENELRKLCDGVTELDLSSNNFKSWEEVFKILKVVPNLTFLNLSYNTFHSCVYNPAYGRLECLNRLVLNGIKVPWKDIYTLLEMAPGVEELYLCKNDYKKVDEYCKSFENVRRLHFNGNPVSEWKEVATIGKQFPNVEVLILLDCPIESINSVNKIFHKLRYLSMSDCCISSWNCIDKINEFPMLCELRINHCPLFENYTDEERRNFMIARLAKISTLNGGGPISENERDRAERFFIRYYKDKDNKPVRYNDLINIHGELNDLADVSLRPQKKVNVKIFYADKSFEKSVSVYIKVSEFKKLLETQIDLSSSRMRLFYIDKFHGISYAPEELKINSKQLYTLNLHSGDEFIVDVKEVPSSPSKISFQAMIFPRP